LSEEEGVVNVMLAVLELHLAVEEEEQNWGSGSVQVQSWPVEEGEEVVLELLGLEIQMVEEELQLEAVEAALPEREQILPEAAAEEEEEQTA
jgi:hypothetical protein